MSILNRWRRHTSDAAEAARARAQAERDLAATKAQTPAYRALAKSLVEIQQVNHLGLNAARILRGDK